MARDDSYRDDRGTLILMLVGAVMLRLIWLTQVHDSPFAFVGAGEATRAALAVARHGTFADAYYQGYGPTAHLMPTMPVIAGGLMRLFGPGAPAANFALLVWSLAQTLCAYLLLRRLFIRLGSDRATIRIGMLLLCLLPIFAPQETVDFRYWEGAAALCFVCLNLLLLIGVEERGGVTTRELAIIAALSAVTFFVSPGAGLAVDACWAVFAIRRLSFTRAAQLAVASTVALAVLLVPWAMRNAQAVGSPILLRSNFGIEFAIGNHPAALSPADPARVFADRLLQIHPYHSPAARAALHAAGGEVAYSRALGVQTFRWVAAHPGSFALLSLRHLSEFFVPRPWQMYFTGWEGLRSARALTIGLITLLGLIGLAAGLFARRRGYGTLALYIGLAALPYALVQPVPRYSYLVYGLLLFLAVELIVRALRLRRPGRAPPDRPAA